MRTDREPDQFCGRCGRERDAANHDGCDRALLLEPPRYCTSCRRRMVVQVSPTTWAARCSAHGEVTRGQR